MPILHEIHVYSPQSITLTGPTESGYSIYIIYMTVHDGIDVIYTPDPPDNEQWKHPNLNHNQQR
jgi:hypothetical protein